MFPIDEKKMVVSLSILKKHGRSWFVALFAAWLAVLTLPAMAGGRLQATGGVSEIEGAAGGGIVPWALIAGYGTRDEIGATAFVTNLAIDDFHLRSRGVAVGLYDRVELSYAEQKMGLGGTVPGQSIEQQVYGVKWRMAGDAVFDQDHCLPQLALGVQYKRNLDYGFVPKLVGAKNDSGTDFYLAATKLHLAGLAGRNLLWNATLRATKANQMGLLGFGGDLNDSYQLRFEGSAALFLTDDIAVGAEYRAKPNNLSAFREEPFKDVFAAYVPNKRVSVTAAWAQLGQIANRRNQQGTYLSLQLSY
jgi:Protein of unknown function (DUF3034)